MKIVIPVKKSLVESVRSVDIDKLDWKASDDFSSITLNESKIEVVQNDITQEESDAITNAANSQLMHGGGVAGAISRKGGDAIDEESRVYVEKHGDIMVGDCGHTTAGKLPSKWVIHTVGPMYRNYTPEVNNLLLEAAVINTLEKAKEIDAKSVSIPAISSGIFGFPKTDCANIMVNTSLKIT